MNYKKQFLTAITCLLIAVNLQAQVPQLNEVWVLDSIKIEEKSGEHPTETTVYPNQRWMLDQFWMKQFSLKEGNKIDCILMNNSEQHQITYTIPAENNWIVDFANFGALQQYQMKLILPDKLILTHEYSGSHERKLVEGTATFYYHKN